MTGTTDSAIPEEIRSGVQELDYQGLKDLQEYVRKEKLKASDNPVGKTVEAVFGWGEDEVKGEVVDMKTGEHPDQGPLFILDTGEDTHPIRRDEITQVIEE